MENNRHDHKNEDENARYIIVQPNKYRLAMYKQKYIIRYVGEYQCMSRSQFYFKNKQLL